MIKILSFVIALIALMYGNFTTVSQNLVQIEDNSSQIILCKPIKKPPFAE